MLGSVTRMFLLFSVALFIVLVLYSFFKAATIEARQRAKVVFLGWVLPLDRRCSS